MQATDTVPDTEDTLPEPLQQMLIGEYRFVWICTVLCTACRFCLYKSVWSSTHLCELIGVHLDMGNLAYIDIENLVNKVARMGNLGLQMPRTKYEQNHKFTIGIWKGSGRGGPNGKSGPVDSQRYNDEAWGIVHCWFWLFVLQAHMCTLPPLVFRWLASKHTPCVALICFVAALYVHCWFWLFTSQAHMCTFPPLVLRWLASKHRPCVALIREPLVPSRVVCVLLCLSHALVAHKSCLRVTYLRVIYLSVIYSPMHTHLYTWGIYIYIYNIYNIWQWEASVIHGYIPSDTTRIAYASRKQSFRYDKNSLCITKTILQIQQE